MKLRLPYACRPDCTLCASSTVADVAAVAPALEHAESTDQRRVYVQGTDVASNALLPALVQAAKSRGLQLAILEDGPGVDLPDKASRLRQMGVEQIYLSLPIAATSGTAASPQSHNAWKQPLEIVVALNRSGHIAPGLHIPLTPSHARELPAAMRLQARLSIREMLISEVVENSRSIDPMDAVVALDRIWQAASGLGLRLRLLGFERTRYVHPALGAPAPSCDESLVETIRQAIPLPSARAGIRVSGEPGGKSTLAQLTRSVEELRKLGLELAAYNRPFIDVPACLGGAPPDTPLTRSDSAGKHIKSDACGTCPVDARCPGAPDPLGAFPASAVRSALRPLPAWHPLPSPARILIICAEGQDPILYTSTLPALVEALRRRGAQVEFVTPWLARWDPVTLPGPGRTPPPAWTGSSGAEEWLKTNNLGGFDLVITPDLAVARMVLATPSLNPAARVVFVDFHMLRGMNEAVAALLPPGSRAADGGWWPSERLILESAFPGYIKLYRNYGVPLEQLAWRPFSLYAGHFPPGTNVHDSKVIFSGGNHLRDLDTLRLAAEQLRADVHPIDLYAPGDRFDGNAHLRHRGFVGVESFYKALARSRFVVLPLREQVNHATGITVLAMALLAGRPIIATDITATRDYVQHGGEGLLVPPGDGAALAEAINRLDTDPELLSTLAAGSRAAGLHLSTDHWAERILSANPLSAVATAHGWRNW